MYIVQVQVMLYLTHRVGLCAIGKATHHS